MRRCFADLDRNDLEFWGQTNSEFHSLLLKKGYCIGWSTSEVERMLSWAKEAYFVLRPKKYTEDNFVNLCIAAAKGDSVEMIFGGAIINLQSLRFGLQ